MTKGQLKNYLDGMLNEELKNLQEGDDVTQEIVDNIQVAFEAILERACDEDDEDESDEDEQDPDANNDGVVTTQEQESLNRAEELKSQGPKSTDTEHKR
jgi:hypothetical protein